MAVAAQALLVADRLIERLPQRDADVFHGVVRIDVQIALGENVDVQQAVPGDLIEHVIEKRQPGIELGLAAAVQIQLDADLGFQSVA